MADWAVRAICESREGSAAAALVSSILRHRSGDGGRVHPHAVASICASLARIGALSRSVIPDRAWAAAPLPEAAGCSSGMDETDEASKADEARAAIGEWADDICATMEELARDKSVGAKYAPAVLAAYIEEIASPGAGARTPMRVLRMLRLGALALYGACKSKELQQVTRGATRADAEHVKTVHALPGRDGEQRTPPVRSYLPPGWRGDAPLGAIAVKSCVVGIRQPREAPPAEPVHSASAQVYASFRGEEMDVKREALSTLRQVYEAEFKHSGRV